MFISMSTAFVSLEAVYNGPGMPDARFDHCLVLVPSTNKAILLGGQVSFGVPATKMFAFDLALMEWTTLEQSQSRYQAQCGVLKDLDDPSLEIVIVAGGSGLDSTEYLSLVNGNMTNEWTEGTPSPHVLYSGGTAISPDHTRMYIVGGSGPSLLDYLDLPMDLTTIYQLQCRSMECLWKKLGQELDHAVVGPIAVIVTNFQLKCQTPSGNRLCYL